MRFRLEQCEPTLDWARDEGDQGERENDVDEVGKQEGEAGSDTDHHHVALFIRATTGHGRRGKTGVKMQ